MQLTKEQVEEFYAEHKGTEYYDSLIASMVSGPVLALGLAREDAVQVIMVSGKG
jgi:nucleoside diphosphate kinase